MSRLLLFVVLSLWLIVASASAQSTGSSFGGSDWSSGGSGGSGGSSSSSSGWTGSSSATDSTTPAYEPSYGVQVLVFVGFIAFLVVLYVLWQRAIRGGDRRSIDVTMMQIVIDWRARRFVQESLAKIATRHPTTTASGRLALLVETIGVLRSAKLAWLYLGARNFDPMPPARAREEFQKLANDARAGFQRELLRAADGQTSTQAAPELRAKEHEGQGVVLVTVLVAARRTIANVSASSIEEIDALLAQIATLGPTELVGMEVVWTPSADADRMSTDELEVHYPKLTRLSANVGRVFCTYCGGPHTAELASCPHCGAATHAA